MSGSISRSEKDRMIERDDGDVDDTVYIVSESAGRSYHSFKHPPDKRCNTRGGELKPIKRKQAQENGQPPCKICVLDELDQSGLKQGGKSKLEKLIERGEVDI